MSIPSSRTARTNADPLGSSGNGPSWVGIVASALAGAAFFLYAFGSGVLRTSNVDWLLNNGDPATYYLGWLFYRHEEWSFPLGRIAGYLAPMGTSICLTDSLPLLAIPLKAVSGMLPDTFQYFGLWMLLSSCLQAVFSYLLLTTFRTARVPRLLAMLLLLTSPVMMYRQGGHIALASHWCLLWALWLYFRPPRNGAVAGRARDWFAVLAVTALIHPYLTVMNLGIAFASLLRAWCVDRSRGFLATLAIGATVTVLVGAVWYISGYFIYAGGDIPRSGGYLEYSHNLNGLLNPIGTSRFLQTLPVHRPTQYEGYAYLGLGALFATMYAACVLAARPPKGATILRVAPVAVVCAAAAIFALSNQVTLDAGIVAQYQPPWPVSALARVFRASGRFIWPGYYLLLYLVLRALATRTDRRVLGWLLAACVLLQAADMFPAYNQRERLGSERFDTILRDPEWSRAAGHFDHVATYPPYQISTRDEKDFRSLALWAGDNRLTISAGYAARISQRLQEAYRAELEAGFCSGEVRPRTLYVFPLPAFAEFAPAMADSFRCALLDGYMLCCSRASTWRARESLAPQRAGFAATLAAARDRLVILAARDEASWHLGEEAKRWLRAAGSGIDTLAFRGAYAGILSHGRVAGEWIDNRGAIDVQGPAGDALGRAGIHRSLRIASAGRAHGNAASIQVDGREFSLQGRGMNALVLDDAGDVVALATFDTFLGDAGVVLTRAASTSGGEPLRTGENELPLAHSSEVDLPCTCPVRFLEGWGNPEPWGRWALAREASVLVPVCSVSDTLLLRVTSLGGAQAPQHCTVRVGEAEITEFSVGGVPWQWHEVRVPLAAALAPPGASTGARVEFEFERLFAGAPEELREFALGFELVAVLR